MERAGANVIQSRNDFAVMGLAEGIGAIPAHLRALRRLRRRFVADLYDLVVLVDYPGFHLRVAAAASDYGIPVLYYIAPQLWAWGSWRLRAIRRHVRQVAAVLPFEEEYFRSRGVAAEFVGHPLLDREDVLSIEAARASLGISDTEVVLGLLPGSRKAEVDRLWPDFRDAAKRLAKSDPSLRVLVAAVDGNEYPDAPQFQYCQMNSNTVLSAADAVLCKSGTASLEAAIFETPTVIAYKMNPITFGVAKRVVRTPHIGLVNLIADREVCPEFVQSEVTPRALASAVEPLLRGDCEEAEIQRQAFAQVRDKLGGAGATQRVADMAEQLVA
jgi:lipid-A-disaccharide synthase